MSKWFLGFVVAAGIHACGCQTGVPTSGTRTSADATPQPADTITTPTATLWVRGLACPQCATNIDQQFKHLPGVKKVDVNLGDGKVVVHLHGDRRPTKAQFAEAVRKGGFTLQALETP